MSRLPTLPRPALLGCLAILSLVTGARAEAPRYPDILPLSAVHAGMKGYGLTVFRGTKIERFDVTVVGVVRKGSWTVPGHDMILVKLAGGPITARGAFKIQGMSGSPVYVGGRVIGAFSQAESMLKEPLGGVTPIEDMLEAWDPALPDKPEPAIEGVPRVLSLEKPLTIDRRRIRRIVTDAPNVEFARSTADTLVLHRCAATVTLPTRSMAAREKLKAALAPFGVEVAQTGGAGRPSTFKGASLVPGAAFSMMLSTGDFASGAIGTITYRQGDRVLGFGHPFMGIGPIAAPLCSAYIYDIYPLMTASYKIGAPGPIVGASTQDRNFSIAGVVGARPQLIDVDVDVRDRATGRSHVYHSQVVQHPNLSPALVSVAVSAAVEDIRGTPGAAFARVQTRLDADGFGSITRTNTVFDTRGIDGAVTTDLDDILAALTRNPFAIVPVRKVAVKVEIEDGRPTATIERVFLRQGRMEPGAQAEIGIVLKPYKKPSVTRIVRVAIPPHAASGAYTLTVRGGAPPPSVALGSLVFRPAPATPDQAPPVNVRQMVDRLLQRERGNEISVRLQLPTTAPTADGERLRFLPPSIDAVLRSPRSTPIRLEREEIKIVEPTEWIVSGTQTLSIDVRRHDMRESTPPATSTPPPAGGAAGATSTTYASADIEDDAPLGRRDVGVDAPLGGQAGRSSARRPAPRSPDRRPGATSTSDSADSAAPADEPKPPSPEPQVGRKARIWRQTARADFAQGKMTGVRVTATGDLTPTRRLAPLTATTDPFVWCVTPDGADGVYAGTGTRARVLHIDASGKSTVVCELPDVSVHALLRDPDGVLWAATSPNGRVYRLRPGAQPEVVFRAPEPHVLCLARDSAGRIYAGVGGDRGRVYRLTAQGKAETALDTGEDHVLALAFGPGDVLYAGTAPSGMIFRVRPGSRPELLLDTNAQSVTGLVPLPDGALLAATAAKAGLIRIAADGAYRTLFERPGAGFAGLCADPNGTLYAAAGSSLYQISGDTVTELDNSAEVDLLGVCVAPNGAIFAGSGNSGGILTSPTVGGAIEGVYESVAHDAGVTSRWGHVRYSASVPSGGSISVETRSGEAAEPDATWSPWSAAAGPDLRITSPPARYLQYRVRLSGQASALPSVREIALSYLPRNQAPRVTFQTPTGGEWWSGKQTVRWSGSDPDNDTLSYELYTASADGGPWRLLPAPPAAAQAGAAPPPGSAPSDRPPAKDKPATRTQTVADVQAMLDSHPDVPAALRQAILDRARRLNESSAPPPAAPPATGAAAPTSTRETTRTIDTADLPDGAYRLKVVASDRPSNAQDALQAEALSERFVVANRAPLLLLSEAKINADRTVELSGIALHRVAPVTGVQYRVDGGPWMAASAVDGLFDSGVETFGARTEPLAAGAHTIEVTAFAASGVSASEKTSVAVK